MTGDRHLATENEPAGLVINYFLKDALEQKVQVVIRSATGEEVATLEGDSESGINQLLWDSSAVEGVGAGVYRVTVSAGGMKESTFAKLLPPRAYAIGQSGGDLHED
jgi:hypothetical protein